MRLVASLIRQLGGQLDRRDAQPGTLFVLNCLLRTTTPPGSVTAHLRPKPKGGIPHLTRHSETSLNITA